MVLGKRATLFVAVLFTIILGSVEGAYIPILQQDQDINPADGSYRYSYGTANGIIVSEQGRVKYLGPDNVAHTVDGSYSYLNDDGTLVHVKYVADEHGYRAVPNVLYRPQAVTRVASPGGGVYFNNYDSLKYALRL
ncbi:endocuticle structural glycoprotein SgAbd-9-like [Macrosteles quadrilineatus]|uniref:endocuticle structural glycoprotein SgAbd-9-like n=1 Tax=Macrosteles quadrilineatus TaxID=74068 RepID=UPI0023E0D155|nr:endocuticle structural glycoprotein SgAbd-9-like [Macrosteles quadrilineatus]